MKPDPKLDPKAYPALALLLPELRGRPGFAVDAEVLGRWTHRDVSTAALNGRIPAKRINGRWYWERANLRKIAELMGVLAKPSRAKRASSSTTMEAAA